MVRRFVNFVLCFVFLAAATAAFADTVNVATGLDSNYNLITTDGGYDAHWLVQQSNNQYTPGQVVMPGDPDWYGGWLANGPNSNWIARDAFNCCNGPAPYTFYTTFYAPDPSQASITGAWAIDDAGVLQLNGQTIDTQGSGQWGSLHNFSVSGSSWFVEGLNTLSITLTSSDNNLEAVRLEGAATGVTTVPEPTSFIMLLSGLGGVLPFARRLLK